MFDEKHESKVELAPESDYHNNTNNNSIQSNNKQDGNSLNSPNSFMFEEYLIIFFVFVFPLLLLVSLVICLFKLEYSSRRLSLDQDKSSDIQPLISKSIQHYNAIVNNTIATINDYNNLLTSARKMISTANQHGIQVKQIPNHLNHYLNSDEYKTVYHDVDNSTYNKMVIENTKITKKYNQLVSIANAAEAS